MHQRPAWRVNDTFLLVPRRSHAHRSNRRDSHGRESRASDRGARHRPGEKAQCRTTRWIFVGRPGRSEGEETGENPRNVELEAPGARGPPRRASSSVILDRTGCARDRVLFQPTCTDRTRLAAAHPAPIGVGEQSEPVIVDTR